MLHRRWSESNKMIKFIEYKKGIEHDRILWCNCIQKEIEHVYCHKNGKNKFYICPSCKNVKEV